MPKPLPLGEVARHRRDGEGKQREKRRNKQARLPRAAMQRWAGSLSERYYRSAELFGSILALSVGLAPASSPKGGALGRPGHFLLDA